MKLIDSLINRYPELIICRDSIVAAYNLLVECFSNNHKLLIAGNGGSYADSEHIVGELMKGFKKHRCCSYEFAQKMKNIDAVRGSALAEKLQCGLRTMALADYQGLNTAYINDVKDGGDYCFAQQLFGFGEQSDVFLAISTSGNSKNILNATVVAKALGIKIIGLTGCDGGELSKVADVVIEVPAHETYIIQEMHLPIYHCICLMLEEYFFKE